MHQIESLGHEKIYRLLLRYSTPAIAGLLAFGFGRLIGNIFVGKFLGTTALAGYTVANSVAMILLACGMTIGTGASVLISMRLGEQEGARKILGTAYIMSLLGGAGLTLFGLIFLEPILRVFGADGAVLIAASDFTKFYLLGCFFQILIILLSSCIRAEGQPLKALLVNIVDLFIRVSLMPIFIIVFPFGITGMAIANVLASVSISIWLSAHFLSKKSIIRLRLADFCLKKDLVCSILKIGMAPFSRQIIGPLLSILVNHIAVANGGESSLAVVGVVFTIYFLLVMPLQGTGMGIQPIIGYNHGAGLHKRVRQTVKQALIFTGLICLIEFALVLVYRESLSGLFLNGQDAIQALTSRSLLLVVLVFPITGIQFIGYSLFQATGRASVAFYTSVFRSLFFILPVLILPHFWGLDGLFLSYPLTELIMAIVVGFMLYRISYKKTAT